MKTFKSMLEQEGGDYRLLDEPPQSRVRVQFLGRYHGREVVWDALVVSLAAVLAETGADSARAYIHIHATEGEVLPVEIGLPVAVIGKPELLKTMVMMRNYKRLRPGRYEFGEAYRPESPSGKTSH